MKPQNPALSLLLTILIAATLAVAAIKFLTPTQKFAYVDTGRLMVGFSDANAVEKELKVENDKLQIQNKMREDSLQAASIS